MTRGIAGIGYDRERDILKGGRVEFRMAPVKLCLISENRRGHRVERRCLSFRDRLMTGEEEGRDGEKPSGSSGTTGTEQDCAALLWRDMMPLCAV